MLFLTAPTSTSQERAAKPGVTRVGVGPTGGFISGEW
jgi:hypothetical protein